MADRTHNSVTGAMYENYRLSKLARLVLGVCIARCPNQYGIYDPSPVGFVLDFFEGIGGVTRAEIEGAISELEQREIIKQFRDGECLWLIKKFKREINCFRSGDSRLGLQRTIGRYPEILPEFRALYPEVFEASPSRARPLSPKHETPAREVKRNGGTSESESESESERNTPPTPQTWEKIKATPPPPLTVVEAATPTAWLDSWLNFKPVLIRGNKTGVMSERKIADTLRHLIWAQTEYKLSDAQMRYGIQAAINKGAGNENYAISAAKGHDPIGSLARTQQSRPGRVMPQEVKISDDIPGVI